MLCYSAPRKLKAAKEKLRQLQDLVAFVQQSPVEGARGLPDTSAGGLADMTAGVGEEAVSQATQTDEANVTVSEGEVPMDAQRRYDILFQQSFIIVIIYDRWLCSSIGCMYVCYTHHLRSSW